MEDKIRLLKFFEKPEYAEAFLCGNLHMNPLEYFVSLEQDAVRTDKNEGADFSIQAETVEIQDPKTGKFVPVGGVINPIIYRNGYPKGINAYCMYGFPSTHGHQIDPRNLKFGSSYVALTDTKEFIERARRAALRENLALNSGRITYVDRTTYHGALGPFRKFSEFSYQYEFRLVLSGGNGNALDFPIGDIRDICVVGQTTEIIRPRFT